MPPGNRLAPMSQNAFGAPPTLAEIQLAARTAQRPAPLTLGERAQEINYGLGRGFTNVLQGNLGLAQALYQDPRAVGSAFVDAARQFAANPVDTVGNSLRGMWNRAKSGPAGLGEVLGENIDPRNFLKPKKAVTSAIDRPYSFKKEAKRVSNLVHAENVSLADYEPKVRTPNKTYAYVGNTDRRGNATRFELKRDFENGTGIRVYVGSDYPYEDLPDPRYDPNNPPLMYASAVQVEGTDVAPAPTGKGAATQMTLEALNIAKRGKGGWMSEGMGSLETQAKYKRLIAAGVPFQRLEDGTYYLMPEDLATLDLSKVSDALNKKYAGRK